MESALLVPIVVIDWRYLLFARALPPCTQQGVLNSIHSTTVVYLYWFLGNEDLPSGVRCTVQCPGIHKKVSPMRVGGGLFIANFLFWNCSSPKLTFLLDITQGSLPPTPLWRQGPASNLNFVFYLIICYLIQSSTSGKCNTADIHRFKRCLEYFTLQKFPSPFWGNHIFDH